MNGLSEPSLPLVAKRYLSDKMLVGATVLPCLTFVMRREVVTSLMLRQQLSVVFTWVSKDTEFCIKTGQDRAVRLPVLVVPKVCTGASTVAL